MTSSIENNAGLSDAQRNVRKLLGDNPGEDVIDAVANRYKKANTATGEEVEFAAKQKELQEEQNRMSREVAERKKRDASLNDEVEIVKAEAKKRRLEAEADLKRTEFCVAREAAKLKEKAVFMKLVEEAQILKMMALTRDEAYGEFDKMDLAEQANYLVGGADNWQATGGMREAHIPRAPGSMVGMAQAIDCGPNTAFAVCETVQEPTLRVLASRHASVGHLI